MPRLQGYRLPGVSSNPLGGQAFGGSQPDEELIRKVMGSGLNLSDIMGNLGPLQTQEPEFTTPGFPSGPPVSTPPILPQAPNDIREGFDPLTAALGGALPGLMGNMQQSSLFSSPLLGILPWLINR